MYKLFWDETVRIIRQTITPEEFNMWFDPIAYSSSEKGKIELKVPSEFFRDQVTDKYLGLMGKTFENLAGSKVSFSFVICRKTEESNYRKASDIIEGSSVKGAKEQPAEKLNHPDLKNEFTFENFVVGSNNDFAYNAALAISRSPGKSYNPFFIYGGVGLGKTHLLHALGNEIYKNFPNKKIILITAENFTNEFISSINLKKPTSFKNKYRNADILLIDDIHFFQDKPGVQEELFNTFNALYDAKKQMVFTCDRPPSELKNLTPRMQSRFSMGLIIDLRMPDYETKLAIMRNKAAMQKAVIEDAVLDLICRNINTSIRDLESALTNIIAYAELLKKPVTVETASTMLAYRFVDKKQGNLSVDTIIRTVSEYFNVSSSDIRGKKRTKKIVMPRHISMYITRNMTELSTSEIGNEFGGRDHTSVIHALQKVEAELKMDMTLETVIQKIEGKIRETVGKG